MKKKKKILTDTEIREWVNFAEKLISEQEDLSPKFQKVIDENFWELLED